VVTTRERTLDRRRFLCAAGAAAVAAVAGEVAARRSEAPPAATSVTVPQLPVGTAHAVPVAGGEVLAVRLDDTTTVAFDRRCPHLGCPVVWAAERGRFECPCHRAAFDARTGVVLFGPPQRGLTPIEVTPA
jgi:Rieske Fe-S protein